MFERRVVLPNGQITILQQLMSAKKMHCAIHQIKICPLGNIIQPLNNHGLRDSMSLTDKIYFFYEDASYYLSACLQQASLNQWHGVYTQDQLLLDMEQAVSCFFIFFLTDVYQYCMLSAMMCVYCLFYQSNLILAYFFNPEGVYMVECYTFIG